MAKKDIFKVCLVAAVVMAASTAVAGTGLSSSTVIGGGTFSPSNKVTINVISDATSYAAKSGHLNGDRTIFTNNTDPKMVWTTKAISAVPATVTGATDATTTTWTTL